VFEPASLHKYLYCHGSPIDNWDPSGEASELIKQVTKIVVSFILINVLAASFTHYLSRSHVPTKWEGIAIVLSFATQYHFRGLPYGVGVIALNLTGTHDNRKCEASFMAIMAGYSRNFWPFCWAISKATIYSPGIFRANPCALLGYATYASFTGIAPLITIMGLHVPMTIGIGGYLGTMVLGTGVMLPPWGPAIGQDIGADVFGGIVFPVPSTIDLSE